MKIRCKYDPLTEEVEIPISFVPRLALTKEETALALGVSLHTIWRLASTGQIAKTVYGTYPVASLQAHLQREMERKGNRKGGKA